MSRWLDALVLGALLAVAILLGVLSLTVDHDWGDDFAAYIQQAASIVEGDTREYVASNRIAMRDSNPPAGPDAAPWGFPLLLAPVYAAFGANLLAFKSVGFLGYLGLLAVLWYGLRDRHTLPGRVLVVGFFAVNPVLLAFLDRILSDTPFLFVSTLCVFFMGRVLAGRRLVHPAVDRCLLGGLIAAAAFLRPNGVLLLGTLGLIQVFRLRRPQDRPRGREWGLLLLPYAVFAVAWLVWNVVFPQGGAPPSRPLTLESILANAWYYLRLPAELFSGIPGRNWVYAASLPFVALGAFRRWKLDHPAVIYTCLTLLLFVAVPYRQGIRYLLPVVPFAVSFAVSGLETAARARPRRLALALAPALLVSLLLARESVDIARRSLAHTRVVGLGPYSAVAREMFTFIRENTESDAVVVFFKPRAMRLLSGRMSIRREDVGGLGRGDYLCWCALPETSGQISSAEGAALLGQGSLEPVFKNKLFQVFRIQERR